MTNDQPDVATTDEAPTPRDERRKGIPWTKIIVTLLILLVMYPLSFGPVLWATVRGHLPNDDDSIVWVLYAPMADFQKSEWPLSDAYTSYLWWWIELGRPTGRSTTASPP